MAASGYAAYRARQRDEAELEGLTLAQALGEAYQHVHAERLQRQVRFIDWALRVPEPKSGTLDFERFPFQRELYEEGAADREVVVKKCLDPDTKVLTADLRWMRIDDLEVGDRLMGTDEETREPYEGGAKRRARTLKPTTVEAKWDTWQEAYRVTLDDGRQIVASADHRLLWRRAKLDPRWQCVRKMVVGDKLRNVTTPWGEAGFDEGWMSGILDGEGCLRGIAKRAAGTEVVITQQPGVVATQIAEMLSVNDYTFRQSLEPRPNGKPVARFTLTRLHDILRLIGSTRPVRFGSEWWDGAKLPGGGTAWSTIVAIEPLGERRLVDLQTTEKTYIAEGIVSHNSTQVGVSAFLVRWTMYWADTRGYTALYVFPKARHLYDFSDSRIRPLVQGSEHLRERIPASHVQNKGLKQIGLGFVYYRGSESADDLQSVNADVLAMDEYDDLNERNVPDAERRITGSQDPMIRRVGVPTIPDYGISRLYAESDRRRWWVKCSHCKHTQHLTFDDNVDIKRGIRVCGRCTKSIESDIVNGEWVSDYPDRNIRGYHIPRLIVPGVDLSKIIDASKAREPFRVQTFHNKDLGEEYAPEEGRLSPQALAAATRDYVMSPGFVGGDLVTMGVDVASARAINVRISLHNPDDNTKGALWIGTVDSFDDVSALMDRYDVKMCCIDHMPEWRLSRGFAERFAGRVYRVVLTGSQLQKVLVPDEEERTITVRRTEAIDAMATMIREQRNRLPMDRPDEYNRHLMANVRFAEKDDLGRVTVGYKATGPDDYAMAEVFDVVATEAWYIRMSVADAEREVFQPLDELMEFQRTTLHDDPDKASYSPGRTDDEYSPGFEDD